METPVISFVGWSNAGKTTLIEKLIPVLRGKGLRVGVLKRDGHEFQMDHEGKDTWRFTEAGADAVAIANSRHAALLINRPVSFETLREKLGNVDLILAEGWEIPGVPQIEVLRGRTDLRCREPEKLLAVVTDEEVSLPLRRISPDAVGDVAELVMMWFAGTGDCALPYAEAVAAGDEPDADVTLTVDGRPVPLLPFVRDILRGASLGIVSTLKDTGLTADSVVKIEIKRK
jgi:molybdopterin-guanine dinucleotide biosynthesis protein B